jgi:hypothetical protein
LSPITCILPLAQSVYTGDESGKVVSRRFSFPPLKGRLKV